MAMSTNTGQKEVNSSSDQTPTTFMLVIEELLKTATIDAITL